MADVVLCGSHHLHRHGGIFPGGSRRPFFQRRAGGRNYGLFGGSIFPMALSVSASKKILVLISYFYTKKYFIV